MQCHQQRGAMGASTLAHRQPLARLPRAPAVHIAPRSTIKVHAEPPNNEEPSNGGLFGLFGGKPKPKGEDLDARIQSGEFTDTGSTKERLTRPMRKVFAKDPVVGRRFAFLLAELGRQWRSEAAKRMPVARGDIREIVGQPVFVPLYKLFRVYGKIFKLSFGPKEFVVVSDPVYTRQILLTNADKYSKGLLSEILDFVMGQGLIPADGELWRARRRAVAPALHRKYVASMVGMFGDSTIHGCATLDQHVASGQPIDMENYFSRLALDIIGKAVFNYDFDSLTHDDPVIKAVYTVLREAEHRSTAPLAYWNLPGAKQLVPRQRRCQEALKICNDTLDGLIAKCKKLVEEEDEEFSEEFLSDKDPSILHFLLASGDQISSKQLRDDLMTMLIAGHETTAAVLTWTFYLLAEHPEEAQRVRDEIDSVLGDRAPTIEDLKSLRYTTRVINESMRLYPQPPVLIRRALQEDSFDQYTVQPGADIFISVWNLHRSPELWEEPEQFRPMRFGPLDGTVPNEVTTNFAYLPFGGGRRKCLGDQFALLEALVGLTMSMRRYEFELVGPVGMTTGATIHTTSGLNMVVRKRDLSCVPPPSAHHQYEQQQQTAMAMAAAAGSSTNGASGCPFAAAAAAAAAAPAAASSSNGAAAPAASGCPFAAAAAAAGAAASNSSSMRNGNGAHAPLPVPPAEVTVGGASVVLGGGISIGPAMLPEREGVASRSG